MTYDFDRSWASIGPQFAGILNQAMLDAARSGIDYLPRVLRETGQSTEGLLPVNAGAFTGYTTDGRPISDLLRTSIVLAKRAVRDGLGPDTGLQRGALFLDRVTQTAIADADRGAVQAALTTTTTVTGWVRMLNPPSCKRCIILAGKWFRWNEGFQRHPGCDCRHIPASENVAGDLATDPYATFFAMSEADQDRMFGKVNAQAIRDGADIYRVSNVGFGVKNDGKTARGMLGTSGRRQGWNPPRKTLDQIYSEAGGNRQRAIELLVSEGYITGGQTVGGNIGYGALGLNSEDAHLLGAGTMGRGGTRIGATAAHRKAAASGIRDNTDSATQTAAERRLHRAVLMAQAVREGRNPFGSYRLTPAAKRTVDLMLQDELNKLRHGLQPKQVYELARKLGLRY